MKGLLKHVSIFVLLIVFLLIPLQVSAENGSNPSGKLRLQTERIGQNGQSETQVDKQTELEKRAPNLFKEETRNTIEEKQKELKAETDKLEQRLFMTNQVSDTTMKNTKQALFASDYTVPKTVIVSGDLEMNNEGVMNNTLLSSLIGMVVLLCGGIFTFMRKMVE